MDHGQHDYGQGFDDVDGPVYEDVPGPADAYGYGDFYADIPHGYRGGYGVARRRGQYRYNPYARNSGIYRYPVQRNVTLLGALDNRWSAAQGHVRGGIAGGQQQQGQS